MKDRSINILIVDDEDDVRKVLKSMLKKDNFGTFEARSSEEALDFLKLKKEEIHLIISDISLSGNDGLWLLEKVKTEVTDEIAVIMITGMGDLTYAIRSMKNGAYDFITKPFTYPTLHNSIEKSLERRALLLEKKLFEKKLKDEIKSATLNLERALLDVKESQLEILRRLANAAEFRDDDTGQHLKRISKFCQIITMSLGFPKDLQETISLASTLHDVGKIGIPDEILLKPGKLTEDEWKIMKNHTIIGSKILEKSEIILISASEKIARHHHEKWDGSGYPDSLQKEMIPIEARICAVADVFDALLSKRPYKKPFTIEESFKIIEEGKWKHFDGRIVEAFFKQKEAIIKMVNNYDE